MFTANNKETAVVLLHLMNTKKTKTTATVLFNIYSQVKKKETKRGIIEKKREKCSDISALYVYIISKNNKCLFLFFFFSS